MSAVMTSNLPVTGVTVPRSALGPKGWTALMAAVVTVMVLAPVLNLVVPADSAFHLSDYAVALIGKIMCYAICALAMDLIWGYTGILSLGHGLFFALGGYGMGMYLMRQIGRDGSYGADIPDFMVFLDWKTVPWHWTLSESFIGQMLLVVLVPGLLAFVFGFFAFLGLAALLLLPLAIFRRELVPVLRRWKPIAAMLISAISPYSAAILKVVRPRPSSKVRGHSAEW